MSLSDTVMYLCKGKCEARLIAELKHIHNSYHCIRPGKVHIFNPIQS